MDLPPQYPEQPPTGGPPPSEPGPPAAAPQPPEPPRPPSARVAARPEPRMATALAAAGAAVAISGSFTLSGDALPGGGGDGSQLPGLLLSALALAAGLALLAKAPSAAFRTAGSVAATLAVPAVLFFLTFDEGGSPPYSTEAILGVSALAWIGFHLAGPARGRTFPLGAGLLAAWLFLLQVTEEPFTSGFDPFSLLFFGPVWDDAAVATFDAPDPNAMGWTTLVLAAAYLLLGHVADRGGARGRGVALAVAPIVMVPVGVLLVGFDLEAAGAGFLLGAIGVVLCVSGAGRGRRGTTWAGALFVYWGTGLVIGDAVGDSTTALGFVALLAGSALVVVAHVVARSTGEPDELEPGPATAADGPPTVAEF